MVLIKWNKCCGLGDNNNLLYFATTNQTIDRFKTADDTLPFMDEEVEGVEFVPIKYSFHWITKLTDFNSAQYKENIEKFYKTY